MADQLLAASTSAIRELLQDGTYVGWLAIDGGGRVIAGAGVHIKPQLPRVSHGGRQVCVGATPLVVNVYTDPGWRRQGIARVLMKAIMDWALVRGCDRVVLHASSDGRRLYESLDFVPSNEMRWSQS